MSPSLGKILPYCTSSGTQGWTERSSYRAYGPRVRAVRGNCNKVSLGEITKSEAQVTGSPPLVEPLLQCFSVLLKHTKTYWTVTLIPLASATFFFIRDDSLRSAKSRSSHYLYKNFIPSTPDPVLKSCCSSQCISHAYTIPQVIS